METEGRPPQLTTDLMKAIDLIKNALTLANAQKASLKEKALAVKSQIQDDVSLHLDLLRNREVWLLEQVDLFAQLKEESIESNQKELLALLAKLEVFVEFLRTTKFEKDVEAVVKCSKVLSGIQNQSLNGDESPDICFFAHNLTLSDAIKNFGKITEELPAVQNSNHMPSRVISKSKDLLFVQEHFNAVLNSPESEWLMPFSDSVDESKPQNENKPADVDAVREFLSELNLSDVNEWLRQGGQPIDVEAIAKGFISHFEKIKKTPLADWIQPGHVVATNNETLHIMHVGASEGPDTWLLAPESLSLVSEYQSAMDEKLPDSTEQSEISEQETMKDDTAENSKWLLTANNVHEDKEDDVKPEPMKIGEKASSKIWLLPSEELVSSAQEIIGEENWFQKVRKPMGKNTRDWLMGSSVEPEYCEWLTPESIERCKNCPGVCAKDMLRVFNDVSDSPRNEWLATAMDW